MLTTNIQKTLSRAAAPRHLETITFKWEEKTLEYLRQTISDASNWIRRNKDIIPPRELRRANELLARMMQHELLMR